VSVPTNAEFDRWCDEAIESWRHIRAVGPEMLELVRKPTTLPDGFGGGGMAPKVAGTAALTGPERAANGRAFPGTGTREDDDLTPTTPSDRVVADIAAAFDVAKRSKGLAKLAEKIVCGVSGRADGRVGRQETSGGICRACKRSVSGGVDDRLRSGYCDACRKAWRRWQERWAEEANVDMAADRLAFEHRRFIDLHGWCHYHDDCSSPGDTAQTETPDGKPLVVGAVGLGLEDG
jgi:hypothetical protein